MFSVNNFYNYLNHFMIDNKKDVDMKSFSVHGSRQLIDITVPMYKVNDKAPKRFTGQAVMFDQEPIDLEYFKDWINFVPGTFAEGSEYNLTGDLYKNLTPEEFIFRHFSGVYNPLLMHSERNSVEVELFKKNHFHPVHYFYHGLIARDWFRHWKQYSMKPGTNSKRLGMYCRDASGSRAYRLDLLRELIPYKDDLYYNLQDPIFRIDPQLNVHYTTGEEYGADASAMIVPEDCQKFDIQIVPETLFNTTKTHLTEKVFKPIVMEQPFIIVGCPGSLKYLKSYGFRTFEHCWDESYDEETDPDKRMAMIMDVVDKITKLNKQDYNNLMLDARNIAKFNRKRFHSQDFEEELLDELHDNLKQAIIERNKKAVAMPGGTYFMYLDQLHQAGHDITDFNRNRIKEIIKHVLATDPKLGRQIVMRYKHLY